MPNQIITFYPTKSSKKPYTYAPSVQQTVKTNKIEKTPPKKKILSIVIR